MEEKEEQEESWYLIINIVIFVKASLLFYEDEYPKVESN
jgi:hypothetical protein